MPLKPLQYLGNFGNQQSSFDREADPMVSDWGSPQIHATESQDGQTIRGQVPRWQPGEFEEWKQAHVMGIPTQYGWAQQQAYKAGQMPGGASPYMTAGNTNPALMALQNMFKRNR